MEKTKYARKIDSMGRITIPIRLREELGLEIGEIYDYYTTMVDGKKFLCIECPGPSQIEIEKAKEILKSAGLTI